ncbi:MAG: hypothetical protein ACE5GI_07630 [Candidatus Aminicenantales bacterium]
MLNLPRDKPKTVKDAIVSALTIEWPLSARKIYNQVRKKYGFAVTYQAVHKAMKELLNDKIILKEGKEYSLNRDWIESIKSFANDLGKVYEDKTTLTIEKAFEQGSGNFTFDNVYKFYMGMATMLKRLALEAGKKSGGIGTAQLRHMYWALASSQKEYDLFDDMLNSYKKTYILCRSDTKADRIAADYYRTVNPGTNVLFGLQCAENCDLIIGGNFVIQIFFEKNLVKLMDMAYKRAYLLQGMKKLYGLLFRKKANINVVLFRNPALAEQIRNEVMGHFKK